MAISCDAPFHSDTNWNNVCAVAFSLEFLIPTWPWIAGGMEWVHLQALGQNKRGAEVEIISVDCIAETNPSGTDIPDVSHPCHLLPNIFTIYPLPQTPRIPYRSAQERWKEVIGQFQVTRGVDANESGLLDKLPHLSPRVGWHCTCSKNSVWDTNLVLESISTKKCWVIPNSVSQLGCCWEVRGVHIRTAEIKICYAIFGWRAWWPSPLNWLSWVILAIKKWDSWSVGTFEDKNTAY